MLSLLGGGEEESRENDPWRVSRNLGLCPKPGNRVYVKHATAY